jgi:hypothetical protein
MGTHREHDGNKGKKVKNSSPPPSQKEKNWTAHESILSLSLAAWNFYFQNCLSPFLARANGMATPPKKKKEKRKNSSPNPASSLKRKNPDLY